jgi:hypothetical protein
MSWKYRIILVLSLFVAGIVAMVFIASKQTIDMVDTNYYEKELKYQGVIDAQQNLLAVGDSVLVKDSGDLVVVHIPVVATGEISEGYLEFLRNADKSKDTTFPVRVNRQGIQYLQKSAFVKGHYKLRAKWVNSGSSYYDERNVFFQ